MSMREFLIYNFLFTRIIACCEFPCYTWRNQNSNFIFWSVYKLILSDRKLFTFGS